MKLEFELNDYECNDLLKMHNFVSEEVIAYYNASVDPYNQEEENESCDLKPIKVKIAYQEGKRPKELEKEHPMLKSLEKYDFNKVVTKVFNARLWNIITN